jgi:hypothetical protein
MSCTGHDATTETDQLARPAVPLADDSQTESAAPVGFDMRNVRLRAAPDVILNVDYLHGRLVARGRPLPVFDDLQSFDIAVEGAQISLDAETMTALVNRVFRYDGSPLSDLDVAIRDGRIEQKGKLHKGLTVPFSVVATVGGQDGAIRLHPEKVKVLGLSAAKMMGLFGLELDDVIKVRTGRGVTIRDNDLMLDPSHIMPAPNVRGRVASATIAGNRLQLVLGSPSESGKNLVVPNSDATNYIWFHGGRIRFGRLTMANADLQLIDADPSDPFDFYSEKYNDQLVAGFSRNTPDGALRTVMPDYADIPHLPAGRLPAPAPPARRRVSAREQLTRSVR